MDLNKAINSFQKKIGTYDKANWEVTVENQDIQQLIDKKLNVANVPTDLLDIDLIRGSTFTKAKPGYHWTQVTYSGILKVFFYPLYYKWWQQQLSFVIWAYFLFLYFLQTIAIGMYLLYQTHDEFKNISWPEVLVPLLATVLLGEMFIHVVSTNFSKPILHTMKKKQLSKSTNESKRGRQKSRRTQRHNRSVGNLNTDESTDRNPESPAPNVGDDGDDEGHNESETEVDLSCGIRNRLRPQDALCKKSEHSPFAGSNRGPSHQYDVSNQPSGASLDEQSSDNENDSNELASTSSISEGEVKYTTDVETADVLFPNVDGFPRISNSIALSHIREGNDLINVSIWDGKNYFMKAKLTFFEIGLKVVNKVEQRAEKSSDHIKFAFLGAILIGILPLAYRIYALQILNKERTLLEAATRGFLQFQTLSGAHRMFMHLFGPSWRPQLVAFIAMVSRISLSFAMFFLLCVAEGAYNMRLMYAKYFGALTSTRRARRNGLPHFRLHKVKNIKAWLSLRSFLKKRGPQRSVDTIVSISFMFGMLLLVAACVQFLSLNGKDDEHFLRYFFSWEVSAWSLVLGVFLIRFIALGSDINRKYRNTSILLTEEINLYLQMEKCLEGRDGVKNPKKKKEELKIANNVLKRASRLLKELEVPFKVSGFIMNPLLSNITRVVVLSLFSGVMSDILGFRLRLWKIKP